MKKKNLLMVVLGVMLCMAQSVGAATFPVAKDATVTADGNGNVTVNAPGESGWVLKQYCQDNLRAGCGNDQTIRPTEDAGGVMRFHLDEGGVASGQVAFNFRNTKLQNRWLAIPDCRVKPGANIGLGMSYYTSDIPESGGALFVYTGSGREVQFPIDLSGCDQARVAVSQRVTTGRVARTSAGDGAMNQAVIKSPDSQNVQTKQIASPVVKTIGHGNRVKVKSTQQSSTVNQKGATVKVGGGSKDCKGVKDDTNNCLPTINAPTLNINFSRNTYKEGRLEDKDSKDQVTINDKMLEPGNDSTTTTITTTTGAAPKAADATTTKTTTTETTLKEVKK